MSSGPSLPSMSFTSIRPTGDPGARGPRPMLARDADSMYWMARYVERAEHVARLLLVTSNVLIDMGELAPVLVARQWQSILTILHLPELSEGNGNLSSRVAQYLTLDQDNPNSIVSCISRA